MNQSSSSKNNSKSVESFDGIEKSIDGKNNKENTNGKIHGDDEKEGHKHMKDDKIIHGIDEKHGVNLDITNPDINLDSDRAIATDLEHDVGVKVEVKVDEEATKETAVVDEDAVPDAKIRWCRLFFQMLNICVGYYLFGYEIGVFNSIQGNIGHDLKWAEADKKTNITLISVMISIGAIFGAAAMGKITAAIGRKWAYIIFDIIMLVGIALTFILDTAAMIVGRFVCGFGVGGFVSLVPMFIHEITPDKYIGYGNALYNVVFNMGLLSAFGLGNNASPADQDDLVWWRIMYFFPSIFIILNMVLLLTVFKNDTPKHCLLEGDHEGCLDAMKDVYCNEEEIKKVVESLENHLHKKKQEAEEYTYKVLCSSRFAKQLLLGIVLMIGIQCTAINVFNYYSTSIFLKTMNLKDATLFTTMLGVGKFSGSIISIFIFGKFSKKKTLLAGMGILCGILFVVSILAYKDVTDPIKYLLILFYLSYGSTIFTAFEVGPEILPDIGLGILGFVHWVANVVVVLTLPYMLSSSLDFQWTVMIYSLLLGLIMLYVGLFYKETHGKTLNEVEEVYQTWL